MRVLREWLQRIVGTLGRRRRDQGARSHDGSQGERDSSAGGRHYVRGALVMAEVALAMMLVTGAGLLLRTVDNLTRVDSGFDRSRMVTFSMTLPRGTSHSGGRAQVYQRILETVRAAPGVEAATAMSDLPLNRLVQGFGTRIESETAATGQTSEIVDYYQFVMSDYFETMGVPIVAGRGFEQRDTVSPARVVIVNETLADRLWKGRNPIGQRLRPNLSASMGASDNPWHTVVWRRTSRRAASIGRQEPSSTCLSISRRRPSTAQRALGGRTLRQR